MKKNILLFSLLFFPLLADSILLLQKGWQLVGSAVDIEDMSQFDQAYVDQIWHFDATTQQWQGYSPDPATQQKINEHNISTLTHLKNWHGFWIKSKAPWALSLPTATLTQPSSESNRSHDIIELKKGWNLISLPIDTVLSPELFDGMTLWKYNNQATWELSDPTEKNFPPLTHIKNSDGFWVKAPKDTNISLMNEASKLKTFTDKEELQQYITTMAGLNQRPYCGILQSIPTDNRVVAIEENMPVALGSTNEIESDLSASGIKEISQTNLQELGVDESDILKHNGEYIFYAIAGGDQGNNIIEVTSFDALTEHNGSSLTEIKLPQDHAIRGLYLNNEQLIVLSDIYTEYKALPEEERIVYNPKSNNHMAVDIYNIANIDQIQKEKSFSLDGYLSNSRLIHQQLYLISTFQPQFSVEYPKRYLIPSESCQDYLDAQEKEVYPDIVIEPEPMTGEDQSIQSMPEPEDLNAKVEEPSPTPHAVVDPAVVCFDIQKEENTGRYFRYDYDHPNVSITQLLPTIQSDGSAQADLIEPEHLYYPLKPKQSTTMTVITQIDLATQTHRQSQGYMGENGTIYASLEALYLISNEYPFYYDYYNYRDRATIYKFGLDEGVNYRGFGKVYGHPLNQFSLSEYNEILRIATTEGFSWSPRGTKNTLYTLKEQQGLLPIQGVLAGLGKEGETIRAVRFMQDHGYIVTARTSDPLYTLDLSDPNAPQKVGELHISGFSSYLHPIGNDKLLGIGQETNEAGEPKGLKIELFDVSDFAHPSSLDKIIYPEGTYSEVEYNHKALAYRPSDQLLALPYYQYDKSYHNFQQQNHLGIYRVKEDQLLNYPPQHYFPNTEGEHHGLIFDHNETTYVSFFGTQGVLTQPLNNQPKE